MLSSCENTREAMEKNSIKNGFFMIKTGAKNTKENENRLIKLFF